MGPHIRIKDKRLDPNHAWRHRFKTWAGDADIQERVVDAIQGHAPSTQGRRYGKVSLKARIAAVRKLPKIEINDTDGGELPLAAKGKGERLSLGRVPVLAATPTLPAASTPDA